MQLPIRTIATSLALSLSLLAGAARADTVQDRFTLAAQRLACPNADTKLKKINLNGHKFNIEGKLTVEGTKMRAWFSHYRKWQPDDDVYMKFLRANPSYENLEVKIGAGGYFGWLDNLFRPVLSWIVQSELNQGVYVREVGNRMIADAAGQEWDVQAGVVSVLAEYTWRQHYIDRNSAACRPPTSFTKAADKNAWLTGDDGSASFAGDEDDAADEADYETGPGEDGFEDECTAGDCEM